MSLEILAEKVTLNEPGNMTEKVTFNEPGNIGRAGNI